MDPLIGLALAHPEQAPVHDLETIRLQVGQDEEQPFFRCRQGTVLIHAKLAGGPEFAIKAPGRHMGLERRLEGRHQLLKLVEGQAGQIQELRGAGLHIGKPYTGHLWCLLSWEAQYTIIGINSTDCQDSSVPASPRKSLQDSAGLPPAPSVQARRK